MSSFITRTQDSRFLMLVCFTIAASAAVGHHCFYESLRGQRVDQQTYNQNQNIYIGTALTTLTKISLSAAVALAYSQILWKRLLGQKLRVSHIDSLTCLVTMPSALDDWRLLREFPLLVTLAVAAWCLSIITVFPPGTLSVVSALANSSSSASVPSMDFNLALISGNYSRSVGFSGVNLEPGQTTNLTFSAELRGSAGALGIVTASTGAIPRIQTAEINSTYSTTFSGPILECSTKQVKTHHVYCARAEMSFISYLSFAQDGGPEFHDFFDLNASLPLETSSEGYTVACDSIASFRTSMFGVQPPQLFVVARTSISDSAPDSDDPRQEWTATSCQLRNSTYEVTVRTLENDQMIDVKTSDTSDLGLATEYIPMPDGPGSPVVNEPSGNRIYNCFAMMAMIGQTVVGTVNGASEATNEVYTDGGAMDNTPVPFPGIFSTRLSTSPELRAFAKHEDSPRVHDTPFASARDGPPLARQLEELFRNMTVAMMSNPATSSNVTVPVLHWSAVNVYKYTAWHLWLAYGIGLLATASILFLGFAAIAANSAPYSTRFSTYLRTAPWLRIEEILGDNMDSGADPLPRGAAKAMVMLGAGSAASGVEVLATKEASGEHLVKRSESID
ncbi:uncharacterized protein RCC_07636 [Ramularia collo-cygni]|uniref:Uncharacterized protein n=1 Tax=Ramularia collo-cygni TaxID=112498 RepID=A0A2D3UY15_9PEZI|nr:uncharacterized protein RCC_07636 [Ramularia collo-cygni]CZT21771.1 uncharacterized protein RCC_07636 [Ramularia collo-cygni]